MARAAVFFFLVAVSLFLALTLAAACSPVRCGNLSISPPFGVVSGGAEENRCAQIGFQVHCTGDTPYLGYYEPDYGLQILDIFYANASLLVSDVHKLGDFLFNGSGDGRPCHVPTADTASKIGSPFSVSPLNRNLLFYNCTKAPALRTVRREGLVETVCRNNTFVRAGGRYGEQGVYDIEGCNATALTVRGPSAGEVNPSDYQELISDGFLITWQPPPAAAAGSSSVRLHRRPQQWRVLAAAAAAILPVGNGNPEITGINNTLTLTGQSRSCHRPLPQSLTSPPSDPSRSLFLVFPMPVPSSQRLHFLSPTMPLHLLPLLLLVASFLRLPPPAGAACSPSTCGGLAIAYPFWLEEAGQPPCGSPSFQLRCNGTHTPNPQALLAHSVFGKYQVVSIFTENSSFVAVDHNLLVPAPGGCPRWWFNVSAGIGLGPYTISRKNRELLVLYNCTQRPQVTPPGFLRTPCVNESFVHLGGEYGSQRERGAVPLPPACSLSVVPVLGFQGGDEYVGSMRRGFLLEWTVPSDNCPKCVASGGECRYGNDSWGFFCSCSGAARPEKCGELRKTN